MTIENSQSDSYLFPPRIVVAAFEGQDEVERSTEAVRRSGFAEDRISVLHGEADAERLDVEGDDHGLGGRVVRALQAILGSEVDHLRRYQEHLRAGDYLVGVEMSDDEAQQDVDVPRAVEALRGAGGTFINYHDELYTQSFDRD